MKIEFLIKSLDLNLVKGGLNVVTGKIGSGKTSILDCLFGEMIPHIDTASLRMDPRVEYVEQRPWIVNSSIKNNIILFKPFDSDLFEKALKYSAMEADLKIMKEGIETQVGKGGDKLSGGQRMRLAIARTIYQDKQTLILDDPISALDNEVSNFIINQLICGLWEKKTLLIVTHSPALAKKADKIFYFENGSLSREGTRDQLKDIFQDLFGEGEAGVETQEQQPESDSVSQIGTRQKADTIMSIVSRKSCLDGMNELYQQNKAQFEERVRGFSKKDYLGETKPKDAAKNILANKTVIPKPAQFDTSINIQPYQSVLALDDKAQQEQAKEFAEQTAFLATIDQKGSFSMKHFCRFLTDTTGHLLYLFVFLAVQGGAIIQILSSKFLIQWSKDFTPDKEWEKLWIYIILVSVSLLIPVLRRYILLTWSNRLISIRLHSRMLFKMIHAPIANFFQLVPSGVLINRFSNDISKIDNQLFNIVGICIQQISALISIFYTVFFAIGPAGMIFVGVFCIFGYFIQKKYMQMRRVLIRHEASASTPIIDRFCDTTSGLTYIRASKIEEEMKVLFDEKVEQNINISLLRQGLETWLQSRMGILSIILVEVPCFAFALLSIV